MSPTPGPLSASSAPARSALRSPDSHLAPATPSTSHRHPQPSQPRIPVPIPTRNTTTVGHERPPSMRWDIKPDKRIRRTFPTPPLAPSTPSYAASGERHDAGDSVSPGVEAMSLVTDRFACCSVLIVGDGGFGRHDSRRRRAGLDMPFGRVLLNRNCPWRSLTCGPASHRGHGPQTVRRAADRSPPS
jgi:hypothetical protein